MTFAQKLRELRQAAGLSEAKLAEQSGVSFGAVHNYGLGIRQPTFAAVGASRGRWASPATLLPIAKT